MNKENIKKLIFQVISDSGDDSTRDGLKGTPERVSKLYEELLSGYGKDINELVKNSLFKTTLDDSKVLIEGKNSDWHNGYCIFVIEKK